jgi:hypothetical protein
MPRGTSAGFPDALVGRRKTDYWGSGEVFNLEGTLAGQLKETVLKVISQARLGIRSEHIFIDFLKDELRALEKVAQGKTRLISSCPLVYAIACRMYFCDFTRAAQRLNVRCGCCVGINPYTQWGRLREGLAYMAGTEEHIIAGDFSDWDKTLTPQLLSTLIRRINEWYGDSETNQLIRRVLWEEVVHSRHLGGNGIKTNVIYQWHKSLASGHPLTSFINSFINMTMIALCWSSYAIDHGIPNYWKEFHDNVLCYVYGDDNLITVSDKYALCLEPFDQVALTRYMASFGFTYTDEAKTLGNEVSFRKISEVTFLKRAFVEDVTYDSKTFVVSNITKAPLSLVSLLETPLWMRSEMRENDMVNVIHVTLCELSLHDCEAWSMYAKKIATAGLTVYGYVPPCAFTQAAYLGLAMKLEPRY